MASPPPPSLVNLLIRHPRAEYKVSDLGPSKFTLVGRVHPREIVRDDFTVINPKGYELACSCYRSAVDAGAKQECCVIYLHGSAGCRRDALSADVGELILHSGLILVTFDFAGCGHSQGDYITLGVRETDDITAVRRYVAEQYGVQRFGLWGRSMGAVAAVRHAAAAASPTTAETVQSARSDDTLAFLVLDSPYCDLYSLSQHVVENYSAYVPKVAARLVGSVGLPVVRQAILHKLPDFDIRTVNNASAASACTVPAYFLHGRDDDFVPPAQSQMLFEAYGQSIGGGASGVIKHRELVEGSHNSARPWAVADRLASFVHKHAGLDTAEYPFPATVIPTRVAKAETTLACAVAHRFHRSEDGDGKTKTRQNRKFGGGEKQQRQADEQKQDGEEHEDEETRAKLELEAHHHFPDPNLAVLAVVKNMGLVHMHAFSGAVKEVYSHRDIMSLGCVLDEDGSSKKKKGSSDSSSDKQGTPHDVLFFKLRQDGGDNHLHMGHEHTLTFFCAQAQVLKDAYTLSVDAMIEQSLGGGSLEARRNKVLANLRYAADTLIDEAMREGQLRDLPLSSPPQQQQQQQVDGSGMQRSAGPSPPDAGNSLTACGCAGGGSRRHDKTTELKREKEEREGRVADFAVRLSRQLFNTAMEVLAVVMQLGAEDGSVEATDEVRQRVQETVLAALEDKTGVKVGAEAMKRAASRVDRKKGARGKKKCVIS